MGSDDVLGEGCDLVKFRDIEDLVGVRACTYRDKLIVDIRLSLPYHYHI